MKNLILYAKKYKKEFILAIICIEAETIFELVIPMIMADIIDVGVANGILCCYFSFSGACMRPVYRDLRKWCGSSDPNGRVSKNADLFFC